MEYTVDVIGLRKAMIDAGYMTIGDLAVAADVDRNTIGGILNGKTRPSSMVIEKIAGTLGLDGVSIGTIFFSKKLA